MAAVRHAWMFRTAAVVFLFFGLVSLWRFGFTDYHPEQRPFGLAAGILALVVGCFLLMLKRFAIGASAVAVGLDSITRQRPPAATACSTASGGHRSLGGDRWSTRISRAHAATARSVPPLGHTSTCPMEVLP